MEHHRDLVIVLRAVRYQDRNLIVTGLSENKGKISVLAKNAIHSRRFGGGLDIFAASDWEYVRAADAEMGILQSLAVRKGFEGFSKDFDRFAAASFLCEVSARVALPWEPCEGLFKLLSHALVTLEHADSLAQMTYLLSLFCGKLLAWLGNLPRLGECVVCARRLSEVGPESTLTIQLERAGWLCPSCQEGHARGLEISARALGEFVQGLPRPWKEALETNAYTGSELDALFTWLTRFLAFHIPGLDAQELKSLRFLQAGHKSTALPPAESLR